MAALLNPAPGAYLPHRYPFLLLDRVLDQQPGTSARTLFRPAASLFPLPQMLLIEMVAQTAGIAAVDRQGEGGFLAAVDQARFARHPKPGETLEVSVRVLKSFGRLYLLEGAVTTGGEIVLQVTLTLGVGPL